jgi:hypothetical protein
LTTSQIGPSSEWKKLRVAQINKNNSAIKFRPIVIWYDSTNVMHSDTLSFLNLVDGQADLSSIVAHTYPYLKIRCEFDADSLLNSPELLKLEVDYKGIAEIGTNFRAVKVNKDTLDQGEAGRISFYIFNAGEVAANDFKVEVEAIKPDYSNQQLLSSTMSLAPGENKLLEAVYFTEFESGERTFKINIDSENQIMEYYKDNNIYTVPFFIKADTTKPTLLVSFNGNDIMDGDYVSPNTIIRMELSDPSNLPISDTSVIAIQLDGVPIYFAQNQDILTYTINSNNPKMVVEFRPMLESGEHELKVFANDGFGNVVDSSGFQKRFLVSDETKILNVYNYPNPIKDNTYFTFRLTQVPEQIKIMVYTIAGRLIKEIVKTSNELNTDFNKIFWDCRDVDGDLLGNGTYLYKIIMKAGDKTETSVNKLAIVR